MISVTRRGNEMFVAYSLLEHTIKQDLDKKAPRTLAVSEPIKMVLTNVPEDFNEKITASDFPKNPERGSHQVTLSKTLYVEKQDIRLDNNKDHFGINPNKIVGLKYAGIFQIQDIEVDKDNNPV
jgi:glutaminyl-tRNA synthetase